MTSSKCAPLYRSLAARPRPSVRGTLTGPLLRIRARPGHRWVVVDVGCLDDGIHVDVNYARLPSQRPLQRVALAPRAAEARYRDRESFAPIYCPSPSTRRERGAPRLPAMAGWRAADRVTPSWLLGRLLKRPELNVRPVPLVGDPWFRADLGAECDGLLARAPERCGVRQPRLRRYHGSGHDR